MITNNISPMFAEEVFKVNLYCSDAEALEFNSLLMNIDINGNYSRIKEFIDRVFKV
jgi:hypothetical protein